MCFDRKIHDLTLCSLNPLKWLVQPSRFDDGSRISPFATRLLLFPTLSMEGLIQDRRVKRSAVRELGFQDSGSGHNAREQNTRPLVLRSLVSWHKTADSEQVHCLYR